MSASSISAPARIPPHEVSARPDAGIFLANMGALWRTDADLAQRIDDLPLDAVVPVIPSRAGPATAVLQTPDGRRIHLHSRYDPETEADRLVDGIDLDDTFCFVVGGFGLGYHVRALHRRLRGDAFVLVTEPDLVLLATALAHVDLTDLLASKKCVILTDTNPAALHDKLNRLNTTMMLGARFVVHPPSEQIAGAFHAEMRSRLTDYFSFCRMSLITLAANSRISCSNVANNLPRYVSTPGIGGLRDRFRGFPAVLVSAGPSIRKNGHLLAEAKRGAVVIAVQTMLKPLLATGVEPDFVTSLDYHELSRRFFENLPALPRTCLVAEPKASWHVIDTYPGPVRLLDNDFARLCLDDALAARTGLKAGATVAHLNFYLAQFLGCDPIILVGQDLGYTGGVYYAPGVALHDLWRPEINRFHSLELKEWERIVRARSILRPIADVDGQRIYTDEQMFTYLQQFESDFAASRAAVIDATEGGVCKRGTQRMTLADALDRYARTPIPDDRRPAVACEETLAGKPLDTAREVLRGRIDEVDGFRTLCAEMLEVLAELETLLGRPREFNRTLARVDVLRTRLREHDRVCRMVSAISQLAELRRFSADRRIEADDDSDSCQRAKRQLKRDVEFVSSFRDGADDLAAILRDALARFKEPAAPGGAPPRTDART